jgi:hypothetical protein
MCPPCAWSVAGTREAPRVGQIRRATGGLFVSVPDCLSVSAGRVKTKLGMGLLVQPLCSMPMAKTIATTLSRAFGMISIRVRCPPLPIGIVAVPACLSAHRLPSGLR